MAHQVFMGDDGILRIRISGEMDNISVEDLQADLTPFLDAATQEIPLNNILIPENLGKISYTARKYFTELNKNPSFGKMAIIDPPRSMRVLSRFIQKATQRDTIKFFQDEGQALHWMKNGA